MENENWKNDVIKILKSKPVKTAGMILLAIVVLRIGINKWHERSRAPAVHMVKVEQIGPQNIDKTLDLPGNIEAIEQATLFAHVSGYLKTIKVDEGDKVKKNQLLAVIDAPDIEQEFRNAKAEFDFKETTRKRYEELLKEHVVSQQEYDKVQAEANQSKARYDNADSNVQYTFVKAPFNGGIARRFKYPGDFISAPTKGGTPSPLFLLVNEEHLRVVINAPQKEVSNVGIGRRADIHVDAFPTQAFSGTITRVDALLDEATKTQRILIDIANPDARLRAGMFASVILHAERKDNVPMVSKDAVHTEAGKSFVFVIKEGKARKIPVTVGDDSGNHVEIASTLLALRDEIVIGGGEALSDGDDVKIMEERMIAKTPDQPPGKSSEPRKLAEEKEK